MGLISELKKTVKKVTGGLKKAVSKVAKGVKKAVKKVGKFVERTGKKVFKGIKELTRNKYVRLGLMITAAVMLPGAIAALPAIKGLGVTAAAVATGAISGAVMGAGGVVLAGGSFKDALKAGAFGAATGAAFAGIGSKIKQAQAAKAGGESLDLTQGKLAAAGDLAEIPATAGDISTVGDVAVGAGEISTAVTSPQDVSAAIADSGLAAKPIGNLTDMSPLGSPDTIFVDEVGAAFAKTGEGLQPISSLNSYAVPDLNVGTSSVTDFTTDISNLQPKFDLTLGNQGLPVKPEGLGMPDPLSLGDPTAGFEQNLANVSPGFKPDLSTLTEQVAVVQPDGSIRNVAITKPMSYGEKLAQGIKDSFSAEKVVDGVMDFGTSIAGSVAMGAIQGQDETIIPGTPSPTLSGVGAGMAYQPFQAALVAADINPLAAYQNLTYGSGDINAAGGELFRQQILPIQVG